MLSTTWRWLRRNMTRISAGVGAVGAAYVTARYVLARLGDARERMGSDRIAKDNLRRRFEQNQEDCTFTVLALLPTATANIVQAMDTERITYQIQQMKPRPAASGPPSIADTTLTDDDRRTSFSGGRHSEPAPLDGVKPKTKRQLWDDLAVSSITRAFTLIYTLALLIMMTRTQLNLLGRRSYLSSVIALATSSAQSRIDLEDNDDCGSNRLPYSDDFEVNRKYLTLSWWLLNRGWIMAMARLEPAVRRAFSHLSPRDEISLDTFAALTNLVRGEMEDAPAWLGFLLPPAGEEELLFRESGILGDAVADGPPRHDPQVGASASSVPPTLRRLMDETSDIVDSPPFSHVLSLLLDAGFAALLDGELAETVFAPPDKGTAPATVQLPKILSSLARQAHAIGGGLPNRYLRNMDAVRDLDAFAAVVYSSNWENELKEPTDCNAR